MATYLPSARASLVAETAATFAVGVAALPARHSARLRGFRRGLSSGISGIDGSDRIE